MSSEEHTVRDYLQSQDGDPRYMNDASGNLTNEIFENSDNEEQLRKQKKSKTRDANVQTQDH